MEKKTVDQVIESWSEEEKESLKELIIECKEREKKICQNSEANRKAIADLVSSVDQLLANLDEFSKVIQQMSEELVLDTYLRIHIQDIHAQA